MNISVPKPRARFVETLQLGTHAIRTFSRRPGPQPTIAADKPSANINAGSNLAFTGDIKLRQKQDVLNSTLLAQLGANAQYDREKSPMEWYRYYGTILENLGWVISGFSFSNVRETGTEIRLDQLALKMLLQIATNSQMQVIQAALEALKTLSNDNPDSDPVVIFEENSSTGDGGNFQLSPVTIHNGNLDMALGAMYFNSTEQRAKFLFVEWGSKDLNIATGMQRVVLNEQIYGTVREAVIEKLGGHASTFVRDLQIEI